jgi:hypothetical protein
MAAASLQVGDLVEILDAAERPPGQPAPPKRYARVLELEDAEGRVTVQVEGRRHPLRLPPEHIRRVEWD